MMNRDETNHLIAEASSVWRSKAARLAPAKEPLAKTLRATMESVLASPTMGYISNALTYSAVVYGQRERNNLIRLLKGGFLRVILVEGPAPSGCKDRIGVDRRHYRFVSKEVSCD